jgi:hypothetical protein
MKVNLNYLCTGTVTAQTAKEQKNANKNIKSENDMKHMKMCTHNTQFKPQTLL